MLFQIFDRAISGISGAVHCMNICVISIFYTIKHFINRNVLAVVLFVANIQQPGILVNNLDLRFQRLL